MGDGEPGQDYEHRARIVDGATGEIHPLPKGQITGLDKFSAAWKHNVDIPHPMAFSGWQMADDAHPAGAGKAAYRIVHKTIRTVPFPQVNATWPNLRINLQTGPVTIGEPRFTNALAARTSGDFMVPEWGELAERKGRLGYEPQQDFKVQIKAHQETLPHGNHIEILYRLPDGDWNRFEEMVAAGRARVAALTMMLDFMYGERMLGPVLTEEVGEVFEDWHWNRLLGGRTVAIESQARLEFVDGQDFSDRTNRAIENFLDKPDEMQNRLRVAAQWYWRADGEPDLVQRYIGYWLCVEAVELRGKEFKIGPVKRQIASLLGMAVDEVGRPVGMLYDIRNELMHGKMRDVGADQVSRVRAIAVALLEYRSLNVISSMRLHDLRVALGLDPSV